MRVFGIAGHSGMGKTTLLERLIPELTARGLQVSLIKHSHKSIDIDRPGKDSYRLREAGCSEVVLLGHERWALMHELRGAPEPTLEEQIANMSDCDLLLVEGYKATPIPKLEVHRRENGKPFIWPENESVVVVATPAEDRPADCLLPWLDLDDHDAIAAFILEKTVL
jgi:molybdopterin-guanine dinucleotide biosynthesis protein B